MKRITFKVEKIKAWKTASWTLTAFTITVVVGGLLTGSLIKGGAIGIVCRLIKIPTYYFHESFWDSTAKRKADQSA